MKPPHEETWHRKGEAVVTRGRVVLTSASIYPADHASLDLAAAAPELFRALRDVVALVEAEPSFNDPAGEPDSYAALVRAKAALEKAKVRQHDK